MGCSRREGNRGLWRGRRQEKERVWGEALGGGGQGEGG